MPIIVDDIVILRANTMKPSEKLIINRENILAIVKMMKMRNARVFGSVARKEDREDSDIDLLVDAPDDATLIDMVRLKNALEDEVGVGFDVLTPDDLPMRSRAAILREAIPL